MSTAIDTPTGTVPSGTWRSDPIHSSVAFSVRHMVVSTFHGRLPEFEATLVAGPDGTILEGSGPLAAVSTDDPNLTGHLLAPDFFDVERHPRATFRGEVVRQDGDRVAVTGELTLKGITRPAELRGTLVGPVTDPYGNQRLGLELETTIDRFDYDMTWSMALPDGGLALGKDVRLQTALELLHQE